MRLCRGGFDGFCAGPGRFAGQRADERVPAHGGGASARCTTLRLSLLSVRAAPPDLAARVRPDDRLLPVPGRRAAFRPPVPGPADPDDRAGVPRGDPGRLVPVHDRRGANGSASLAVTGGLAGFLYFAHPEYGTLSPPLWEWLSSSAALQRAPSPSPSSSRCAGRAGGGRPCSGPPRPSASPSPRPAPRRSPASPPRTGPRSTGTGRPTPWPFFGALAVFLAQNAFHAGPIVASQSTLVLVDPLASILIGIGLFGDNLQTTRRLGAPRGAVAAGHLRRGVLTRPFPPDQRDEGRRRGVPRTALAALPIRPGERPRPVRAPALAVLTPQRPPSPRPDRRG